MVGLSLFEQPELLFVFGLFVNDWLVEFSHRLAHAGFEVEPRNG